MSKIRKTLGALVLSLGLASCAHTKRILPKPTTTQQQSAYALRDTILKTKRKLIGSYTHAVRIRGKPAPIADFLVTVKHDMNGDGHKDIELLYVGLATKGRFHRYVDFAPYGSLDALYSCEETRKGWLGKCKVLPVGKKEQKKYNNLLRGARIMHKRLGR